MSNPPRAIRFLLLLAALTLACTCTGLTLGPGFLTGVTPTPTALILQPSPTSVPTPTEAATLPAGPTALPDTLPPDPSLPAPPPASDDLGPQYEAMREGFERDVDAHADGARYWLTLDMTFDPVRIEGAERVRYINTTGETLDEIVFRLYPNILSAGEIMHVDSVTLDDRPVENGLLTRASALSVALPEPLPPGEQLELVLTFDVELPPETQIGYGRLADMGGIVSLPSFYPMLSVYDAEAGGWWIGEPHLQGDPAYSEVALYDVQLEAPSDVIIASTGIVYETILNEDGTTTGYHIVTGPVRDFAIGASREFEVIEAERDGVTYRVWTMPGDEADDIFAMDTVQAAVRVYSEQFGAYPFSEMDVVETNVLAAGIEYPGLIYIAAGVWDREDMFFEWVLVHETGHQWWYSMVGNNQVDEPWLDEGLTEYSVEVYFRETEGEDAGLHIRDIYWSEIESYVSREGHRLPVGLPVSAYSDSEYRAFVYSGGALFFSQLYEDYGPDATREFLQAYYDQYRYRVAHNEDVRRLAEEVFGAGVLDFFDEWVITGSE